MPKKLEKKLKKQARKKFGSTTSKRAKKYIYGTLRKTGWRPKREKEGVASHTDPIAKKAIKKIGKHLKSTLNIDIKNITQD